MRCLRLLLLGILVSLATPYAHNHTRGYYPKGGADVDATEVSIIQLVANPRTYDGKVVRLIGYLHLEFEGDVLYLDRESFHYSISRNGIWLNVPKNMTAAQEKIVNDHYVICTGRFIADMHGHMDLNGGELSDVTRIELWDLIRPDPAKAQP